MQALRPLKICPDQVRQTIMEWLIPMTEEGITDDLLREFAKELAPFAAAAARRALWRNLTSDDAETMLLQLHPFLNRLLDRLESIAMNPDMMAVANDQTWRELIEARGELHEWLHLLSNRPSSPQVTVQPTAEIIFAGGGAP